VSNKGGALAELDLSLKLTPKQEEVRLAAAQDRLLQLRLILGGLIGETPQIGPPLCVVFEGWDASGKGGAIKRLVAPLDPRHVRVAQFSAPTYDEKRHHFLWRFWPTLPGWGGMAVLDRSWYGRVLVERVEGFATEEQWQRAYKEIVDFEQTLADEGMILVKFWLHLSSGEQLKRFKERERDPLKTWKLTAEDWRNREKRRQYKAAVEEMLDRTDHAAAPWVLVEAEDKRWARVKVVESVVKAIEAGLAARGLPVPPALPAAVAQAGYGGVSLPNLVGDLRDQFELAFLGLLADQVPADRHRREPALGGQREPLAVDVAGRLVDAGDEVVDRFEVGELARHQAEHDHLVVGHVGQRLERARPLVVVLEQEHVEVARAAEHLVRSELITAGRDPLALVVPLADVQAERDAGDVGHGVDDVDALGERAFGVHAQALAQLTVLRVHQRAEVG
jgi:polyphosphate kinase 2 (PPK2 family)